MFQNVILKHDLLIGKGLPGINPNRFRIKSLKLQSRGNSLLLSLPIIKQTPYENTFYMRASKPLRRRSALVFVQSVNH